MSIKSKLNDLKKVCKQAREQRAKINAQEVVIKPRVDVPNDSFVSTSVRCRIDITNPSCQEYM